MEFFSFQSTRLFFFYMGGEIIQRAEKIHKRIKKRKNEIFELATLDKKVINKSGKSKLSQQIL